jgi:hypothetical protein
MTMTRLDPPIPLTTPLGDAWAHFVIDYSQEHDLLWVCFQAATGECWTWSNREIRLQPNRTMQGATDGPDTAAHHRRDNRRNPLA